MTNNSVEKENFLDDIEELTRELRDLDNESWRDLRELLKLKSLSVNEVLLVAFAENEAGMESGLLVTWDDCFEYEAETDNFDSQTRWLSGKNNLDLFDDMIDYVDWAQDSFEQFCDV